MKKNVGMTIAQKSKETRVGIKDGNGIDLCSVYNPHIYIRGASDYSAPHISG